MDPHREHGQHFPGDVLYLGMLALAQVGELKWTSPLALPKSFYFVECVMQFGPRVRGSRDSFT
jgi:hypothetical protein